jgi:hypothetical protein
MISASGVFTVCVPERYGCQWQACPVQYTGGGWRHYYRAETALMAEMIPEYLPDHATQGERAVFAALQQLPSEVLVFYEPIIKRRYPDFIVIDPQAGILVVEVKGRRAGWIQEANRRNIRIRQAGNERVDDHPIHQARKYQDRLMSLAQAQGEQRLPPIFNIRRDIPDGWRK